MEKSSTNGWWNPAIHEQRETGTALVLVFQEEDCNHTRPHPTATQHTSSIFHWKRDSSQRLAQTDIAYHCTPKKRVYKKARSTCNRPPLLHFPNSGITWDLPEIAHLARAESAESQRSQEARWDLRHPRWLSWPGAGVHDSPPRPSTNRLGSSQWQSLQDEPPTLPRSPGNFHKAGK